MRASPYAWPNTGDRVAILKRLCTAICFGLTRVAEGGSCDEGPIDLQGLLQELVPRSPKAAPKKMPTPFVAKNNDILKIRRVFSALVPTAFGGGRTLRSDLCAFLAGLLERSNTTRAVGDPGRQQPHHGQRPLRPEKGSIASICP